MMAFTKTPTVPDGSTVKPIIVSLLVFCDLVGIDRSSAQLWIHDGLPILRRRGGHRGAHQIDLGPALRWIRARDAAACEERLSTVRANPAAEAARTKKLAAEARIAEANARQREGELVVAADVGERWGRMALAARERLLSLPATLVQRGLVQADHEDQVVKLVHDALAELSARGAGA